MSALVRKSERRSIEFFRPVGAVTSHQRITPFHVKRMQRENRQFEQKVRGSGLLKP
jgi:hypothetical protein